MEVMVLPSGRTTEMSGEAPRRLWQGAWMVRMNAGAAGVSDTGGCEHGVGRCWCDRWRGGDCGDI